MRLLSFAELKSRGVPWCRDHLRRKCAAGEFPKPIPISDSRIAWIEVEVDDWIALLVAERDGKAATPEPVSPQTDLPDDDDQGATSSQRKIYDVQLVSSGRLRGQTP
jgi:prophage regulatory protein